MHGMVYGIGFGMETRPIERRRGSHVKGVKMETTACNSLECPVRG